MGSLRVRHDWATSLWLFTSMHWRRTWQPLQCSCLENPMDRGAWWAAVYGVAQSRTGLKQLSSSSREGSTQWIKKSLYQEMSGWNFRTLRYWSTPGSLSHCPNCQSNRIKTIKHFQTNNISQHSTPMHLLWEVTEGCSVIYLEFWIDNEDEKKNPSLTSNITLGKLLKLFML